MSKNINSDTMSRDNLTAQELGVELLRAITTRESVESIINLIKLGADVNARDAPGRSPLYFACSYNNTEIATSLIERGADVNAGNAYDHILLYRACNNNNTEIATRLIEHGADVDLSLLKAFVRNNEINQINSIMNNPDREHATLHIHEDRNNTQILDLLHFPSEFDGSIELIGTDGNNIELHFDAGLGYLMK